MKIGIIGCGIAGLAAAQVIAESGLDVMMFERESTGGGHANVLDDGEHCPRFFLDDYTTLLGLLSRVPGRRSASVVDDMIPVTRMAFHAPSGQWEPLDHLYSPMATGVGFRGKFRQYRKSRERRHAFLVAQETFQTSTIIASRKSYGLVQSLRVVRSFMRSRSGTVLPGDTSRWLIEPWVAYLANLGVDVRFNCAVEGIAPSNTGVEVRWRDGVAELDGLVLATFTSDALPLFESCDAPFPYPTRQHTHCKALTMKIRHRAEASSGLGASPTVRYSDGITVLHQPEEHRCVALCLMTTSTDDDFVVRIAASCLGLEADDLQIIGVRENQDAREAVWVGDYCDQKKARAVLGERVALAGSWLKNSYPVDSGEGAARTGVMAAESLLTTLRSLESR